MYQTDFIGDSIFVYDNVKVIWNSIIKYNTIVSYIYNILFNSPKHTRKLNFFTIILIKRLLRDFLFSILGNLQLNKIKST